eukprot:Hpha_TRINITY_DN15579_c1_g1::TRINITY_DN15579_c1_g1_i3::g.106164::m.106164
MAPARQCRAFGDVCLYGGSNARGGRRVESTSDGTGDDCCAESRSLAGRAPTCMGTRLDPRRGAPPILDILFHPYTPDFVQCAPYHDPQWCDELPEGGDNGGSNEFFTPAATPSKRARQHDGDLGLYEMMGDTVDGSFGSFL